MVKFHKTGRTGKIKTVPIKSVVEGMQVLWNNQLLMKVCKTNDPRGGLQIGLTKDGKYTVNIMYCDISELKVLVVECEISPSTDTIGNDKLLGSAVQAHYDHQHITIEEHYKQLKEQNTTLLPLDESQWDLVIKDEMVDTEKTVNFESGKFFYSIEDLLLHREKPLVAKIIIGPPKNYTKEEILKILTDNGYGEDPVWDLFEQNL